jgi:hypothetical protein
MIDRYIDLFYQELPPVDAADEVFAWVLAYLCLARMCVWRFRASHL